MQHASTLCSVLYEDGKLWNFLDRRSLRSLADLDSKNDEGPALKRGPGLHEFFVQDWGQVELLEAARYSVMWRQISEIWD